MEKCEKQFCDNFDASKFSTRNEAIQEYMSARQQVFQDFEKNMSEAETFYNDKLLKYSKKYEVKRKMIESFDRNVDVDLQGKVMFSAYDTLLPPTVLSRIKSIIPSKPSPQQIQKDLVGHSLSEGIENGYHSSSWRWKIEEGEISNFNIESVLTDLPDEYILVADMRLTGESGKAYNAKVKISYVLPQDRDWTIEFAQSQGMYIVNTGKYDDCIHAELSSGWLGSSYIIENDCEIALEVGGRVLEYGGWKKFSVTISPHSNYTYTFVDDGRIDYVSIP